MSKPDWPGWWRIIALSSTIFAVEFAYAVEAGYGTPTLLKTGLQERYATLMWSVSPLLGILFQSYLGSASDKCTCSWGRRRPFILLLGIATVLGLAMFPYGVDMGSKSALLVYTLVVFVVMDFCLDGIQSPCRMYLLDSLSEERTKRGNLMYTIVMDVGSTLGGVFAAIPWNRFGGELGDSFETQTKIVFGVTAVLFLVSLLFTVLSVNENETRALREGNDQQLETTSCKCCSIADTLKEFCSSIGEAASFVKNISFAFFVLWLFTFFGYFSAFTFYLFFTQYVGSVIYGGVANSEDMNLRNLYDEGVLVGCACLTVCNGSSVIFSITVDFLLNRYKIALKSLSLFTFLLHLVVVMVAMFVPDLYTAVMVSLTTGLLYSTLSCVSFTLASDFEVQLYTYCDCTSLSSG